MDRGDRVLVTGATGFIGGRLVEVLAEKGVRIRVATSNFQNCARVARYPVEFVKSDLRNHASLANAVAGCNVVFHCAYRFGGNSRVQEQVNLDGTRILAEALLKSGGRRFVHISSVTAYGDLTDGEITEETAQRASAEPYANTKRKIEQVLLQLHRSRGLPVAILQPTIVYGPYGSFFTTRILEEIRSGRPVIPAGGFCNAVYVDDVVSAAILAAERDAAVGEKFIISGSSPTTWRSFYGEYEKMLGKKAVIELDDTKMRIEVRRQRKNQSFISRGRRALAKRPSLRRRLLRLPPQQWLLAGLQRFPGSVRAFIHRRYESLWDFAPDDANRPLFLPTEFERALYSARTTAKISKAREVLGYNPAFDLDAGMARTAAWARWANLLSL